MSATIILGVYDFLGFHLCNHLLNQGNEVIGIQWTTQRNDDLEEKELYFVRNDNFTFLEKIEDGITRDVGLVCLDLYDLISFSFEAFQKIQREIEHVVQQLANHRFIIFLPILHNDEKKKEVENWKNGLTERASAIQWTYISGLYGPWLDEAAVVQSFLTQDGKEPFPESHLIYIDDFLLHWDKIVTDSRKELIVRGGSPNEYRERGLQEMDAQSILNIEGKTSLIDGLKELRIHNEKRNYLYKRKN